MPINHLGYRPWHGRLTGPMFRWWCITSAGIKLAQKSILVKRMLFAAWLPVLYWGVGFFLIGQAMEGKMDLAPPALQEKVDDHLTGFSQEDRLRLRNRVAVALLLKETFASIPKVEKLASDLVLEDEAFARNRIWCWLLMSFFRYPQGLMILFLVGMVAPSLISQDIRSRAFLLYLSRPITKTEYIVGKFFVPAVLIALVTTIPAMGLYFFGILMSPDLSVFWNTWDVPLRILLGTVVLVLPTVSIALMFSALTQESRYASFSWFAFFTLGHAAWLAIVFSFAIRGAGKSLFDAAIIEDPSVKQWGVLSLYNNVGEVQGWVFGFAALSDIWPGLTALAVLTVVALIVVYRQVSSPFRV